MKTPYCVCFVRVLCVCLCWYWTTVDVFSLRVRRVIAVEKGTLYVGFGVGFAVWKMCVRGCVLFFSL